MRIIRGKYGRRRFDVPTNITARPTTDFARENIFNVLENLLDFDAAVAVDLFAGTGAVSFELLSRGCASVTAVEKAATQYNFIKKVATQLQDPAMHVVRGDVFRFLANGKPLIGADLVFADPPYNLPQFEEVPERVLSPGMLKPGALFVLEHSAKRCYKDHPWFLEHRAYGSVNLTIFRAPEQSV